MGRGGARLWFWQPSKPALAADFTYCYFSILRHPTLKPYVW